MATPLSPEQIERLARRRAGAKLGWYVHAGVYLLFNGAFFVLSEFGVGHRHWSVYPALGWGLGVVLHGIAVFVLGPGSGVRERLIERERERLRRTQR
ncbi:membrane protein [Hylemonella gracilis str. Niagara R]|uniref:Membrane protein n=1 Tax=Hylemonella gracilis str. Niagara R TaxID=1458275 RepID=A0A016XEZ2_9BURK|nr:2TM domain-containing protein [Hylemonella gracilis]EYC50112.1 membrane protein [Hylemonella gracilis str. Niagara R]